MQQARPVRFGPDTTPPRTGELPIHLPTRVMRPGVLKHLRTRIPSWSTKSIIGFAAGIDWRGVHRGLEEHRRDVKGRKNRAQGP